MLRYLQGLSLVMTLAALVMGAMAAVVYLLLHLIDHHGQLIAAALAEMVALAMFFMAGVTAILTAQQRLANKRPFHRGDVVEVWLWTLLGVCWVIVSIRGIGSGTLWSLFAVTDLQAFAWDYRALWAGQLS